MVNGMGLRDGAVKKRMALLVLGLGFLVSGCMQQTIEPASDANLTPRDRKLLANPPYAQANIPEPYLRHIVDYHRKEGPGTIVIDPDARYLYYVLDKGKAIRYGVTVGEEALVWSGRGHQPPTSRNGSATSPTSSAPARITRSERAVSTFTPTARTRCTVFTGPISRNTSARLSPPVAFA
jgi:lipoprotein-anchoring transpeptidase ErfK/SrfK